jgi:predicted nucleic acid-binding protein
MRLIVADAGPIHYLVLIGQINLLAQLFEKVFMPSIVRDELSHKKAPAAVRDWMNHPPAWLEILPVTLSDSDDPLFQPLDSGERAALLLATSLKADLVLMDDREGVVVARKKGFAVTGTIGLLDLAAQRGMIQLAHAFKLLQGTNFRYPQEVIDILLNRPREGE